MFIGFRFALKVRLPVSNLRSLFVRFLNGDLSHLGEFLGVKRGEIVVYEATVRHGQF
jgi:hypothetical protein